MSANDPRPIHQWLDLELDGELTAEQAAELERRVSGSPELDRERRELARLHAMLESSKIDVRPGFRDEVMASLPATGWSARHPRTWWVAAVVLAVLGGSAALLTGLTAAQLEPVSPFVAAMAAVGDLVASSVAAGAGLIGASWRGIGLALREWLGGSIPNAVAFAVVVVGVNVLLLRRLRRRPRPASEAASPERRKPPVE